MRVVKWLVLLSFGATPVVFCQALSENWELAKVWLLIWLVALGLSWLVVSARLRRPLLKEPVGLALVGFLASTGLSALFSIYPRASWLGEPLCVNGVLTTATLVGLFFLCRASLRQLSDVRRLFLAASVAGSAGALYALVQYSGHDPFFWTGALVENHRLRPGGTLGHPNFLSSYLVLCLTALPVVWPEWNWKRTAVTALYAGALLAAQSRGAWLSLAVGGAVWFWLAHPSRRLWLLVPSAAGLLLQASVVPLRDALGVTQTGSPDLWNLSERVFELFHLGGPRLEYLKGAWAIFKRYPWFGSGTDTFRVAFEHVRSAHYWAIEYAGAPHRAHNEVANIAATQGAVGLLALCLLLWAAWGAGQLALRTQHFPEPRRLTHSLCALIAAYLVQGLGNFPVAATSMLFVAALAVLVNVSRGPLSLERRSAGGTLRVPLVSGGLLVLALTSYSELRVSRALKEAKVFHESFPEQALNSAELAVELAPESDVALAERARAKLRLIRERFLVADQRRLAESALADYGRAFYLNSEAADYAYQAGRVSYVLGDQASAVIWFALAQRLEPANPVYARP